MLPEQHSPRPLNLHLQIYTSASYFFPHYGLFMRGYGKEYFPKARRLHTQIGRAIAEWVELEFAVFRTFSLALGLDEEQVAHFMQHITTFNLLLNMADAAVRTKVNSPKILNHWISIVELVRELSGDRNHIAHAGVFAHGSGVGCDAQPFVPKVGPSNYALFTESDKRPPMDAHELGEIVTDFAQAKGLVEDFTGLLETFVRYVRITEATEPEIPDQFKKPIVRRRPPRKQRQNRAPNWTRFGPATN